jgi:hypothetical protein
MSVLYKASYKTTGRPPGDRNWLDTSKITALVLSWAIFGGGLQWSPNAKTKTTEETADQVPSSLAEGLNRLEST